MSKVRAKRNLTTSICLLAVICVAIFSGYFLGNLITNKHFITDKFGNLTTAMLRDDISKINVASVDPDDVSPAIAYQVAEKVMKESTRYEARGRTLVDTSAGVHQESSTIDRRNGDDLYFGFTTYSPVVKVSMQSYFNIGGDVNIQNGTPTDGTVEHVNWSNSVDEFTWEEYKDYFGRYANESSCFLVSTRTVRESSAVERDGDLYKFTVVLDPELSTIGYVKQIGNTAGVNPALVVFNYATLTIWLDEDFKFVKQKKSESYSLPYAGINLTLMLETDLVYEIE